MLRGLASPECRYLLALCCYKLRRLPEAERALLGTPSKTATKPGGGSVSLEPTLDRVPAGAAGFHLLGLICKETGRRRAAVSRFSDALSLDPFLWCAHEELCGLGAGEEARDAMMAAAATSDRYPPLAEIGGIVDARAGDGIFPPPSAAAEDASFSRAPASAAAGVGATPLVTPAAGLRAPATIPTRRDRPDETPGGFLVAEAGPLGGAGESEKAGETDTGADGGDFITPSPAAAASAPPPPAPKGAGAKARGGGGSYDGGTLGAPDSSAGGAGPGPGPGPGGAFGGGRGDRRKFVDEGKLRKVSGRLFSDAPGSSGEAGGSAAPRRSSRLASIAATGPSSGDGGESAERSGPADNNGVFGAAATEAERSRSGPGPGGFPETPGTLLETHSFLHRGTKGGRGRGQGQRSARGRDSLDGKRDSLDEERDGSERGGKDLFSVGTHAGGFGGGFGSFFSGAPLDASHARHGSFRPANRLARRGPGASGRFAEGAAAALALLAPLAEALRLFSAFRCAECAEALKRLPEAQFATGYVLCLLGRARAEMVDYPEAERAFAWARRVDPRRLEGMETYSTVLWHLKKETALAHLAQDAAALDRRDPRTWCVVGNCFSLQKEHETALRFFQRALQLDARCAYAHTLCGHEYFAVEDFEKATASYRAAIRLDAGHYNAWYGLGTVYYRQEKYELSEYHFRHALSINDRSSVLHCYLGMAQHALRRNAEALEALDRAVALDRRNPLAKYEKASVLLSDDRFQDALRELEQLKEVAPREASVFFLMGRIYKKLDLPDRAMVNFSVALDLKPAAADVNLIKSAIEKLHVPDDSEDEDL